MRKILIIIVFLALILNGCGGGGSGPTGGVLPDAGGGFGTAKIIISWPESTISITKEKAIPLNAQSILLKIISGSTDWRKEILIQRKNQQEEIFVDNVPSGPVSLEAIAYPNLDGTGEILDTVCASANIIGGQATQVVMEFQGGTVEGKVVEGEGSINVVIKNIGISGATVEIKEIGAKTFTDSNGFYKFNKVNVGKVTISVYKSGYRSQDQLAEVRAGQITTVNFSLKRDPDSGKKIAVIVGINDYKCITDLWYSVAGAETMYNSLNGSRLWSTANLTKLRDSSATKGNIYSIFMSYKGKLGPRDTFLFYFGGHGTNIYNGVGILCPHEFAWTTPTLITEYELLSWLKSLASSEGFPQIVVILEACRCGAFIGKTKEGLVFQSSCDFSNFARVLSTLPNAVVLTATKGDELGIHSHELRNAVFTYYLGKGLGYGSTIGEADSNGDVQISVEEAYKYAAPLALEYSQYWVSTYSSVYLQYYGIQITETHPQMYDNDINKDVVIK